MRARRRTAYEARLGQADVGDMVAEKAVSQVVSAGFSAGITAALQAFNVVIPGLGLLVGFALSKFMGGGPRTDPRVPPMIALMNNMKAAMEARDYRTAAQLAGERFGTYPPADMTGARVQLVFRDHARQVRAAVLCRGAG